MSEDIRRREYVTETIFEGDKHPPITGINADLIGFEFKGEGGLTYRVVSLWDPSAQYVLLHDGYQEHLRPAAVVRRRKQLDTLTP